MTLTSYHCSTARYISLLHLMFRLKRNTHCWSIQFLLYQPLLLFYISYTKTKSHPHPLRCPHSLTMSVCLSVRNSGTLSVLSYNLFTFFGAKIRKKNRMSKKNRNFVRKIMKIYWGRTVTRTKYSPKTR